MSLFTKLFGENKKTENSQNHQEAREIKETKITETDEKKWEAPEAKDNNEDLARRTEIAAQNINELGKADFDLETDPALFMANFEKTFGMPAKEFMNSYVNTAEILKDNEKLSALLSEFQSQRDTELADATGYEGKKTSLSKIRKMWEGSSFYKKAATVGLLLFLKFAPQAMAGDQPTKDDMGKDKNKTEVGFEKKTDGPDTKTYKLAPSNTETAKIENLAKLDLTNSFEVNKADISAADKAQIEASIDSFLSEINSANIGKILESESQIKISCDERPTLDWENGNEGLAKARAAAFKSVWEETIKNYEFDLAKTGLTADDVAAFKAKELKEVIPQGGITPVTAIKNSATGINWTAEEFNKLSKTEKENIYKECRFVKIELMAYSEAKKIVQDLTSNECTYLIDDSGSMSKVLDYLANSVRNMPSETKILKTEVAFFSDKLDKVTEASGTEGVAKALESHSKVGESKEKTTGSTLEYLTKLPDADSSDNHKIIKVFTNEAIQDLTMDKLIEIQKLEKQKDATVEFYFPTVQQGSEIKCLKINSAELAYNFMKQLNKKVKAIEEQIQTIKDQAEKDGDRDLTKQEKQTIKALEQKEALAKKGEILMTMTKIKDGGQYTTVNLPIYQ